MRSLTVSASSVKTISMPDSTVSPDEVLDFRQRHELTHEEFDLLFGSASEGRSSRRWHKSGAPRYVSILMAYADKYGLGLMVRLAKAYQQDGS